MNKVSQSKLFDLIDKMENIRLNSNKGLNEETRGKLSQFMTSKDTAALMSSMFQNMNGAITLLDADTGVGSLTTSFVNEACSRNEVSSINSKLMRF